MIEQSTAATDSAASRSPIASDRWDEMWNGELHMTPAPTPRHQMLSFRLATFLDRYWAQPQRGAMIQDVNVAAPGSGPRDYRIPDITLIAADQMQRIGERYIEGPASVVVEILSPDDDSYEKLDFYFAIGVTEAWIVDQATGAVELFIRGDERFVARDRNADGWVVSDFVGAEFKGGEGNLLARMVAQPSATETAML